MVINGPREINKPLSKEARSVISADPVFLRSSQWFTALEGIFLLSVLTQRLLAVEEVNVLPKLELRKAVCVPAN